MSFCKSFLKYSSILVALLAVFVYYKFIKTVPSPILQLKDGKAQGIVLESREGRKFNAYYGLPFAKPPLGALRFKSPIPAEKWEGIYDASYLRSNCAQRDIMIGIGLQLGSEDCLYLNVYAPSEIPPGKKLPVMAYIHGGYFHVGGGDLAGPKHIIDKDVILVTIQYRLGVLGFLKIDDIIRGNMGLKDQNLALKWIQTNIEAFKGDKTKVTIFGESAGGASTHYHMISPASKGLFYRAIRQSGSALNYWTIYRNSKAQAQNFAKRVNCSAKNSQKMADCLQTLDLYKLLEGHSEMLDVPNRLMAKFVPTIEDVNDSEAFLTEEPIEILRSGRFNKVPFLTGYNFDEGLLHSTVYWANQTKLDSVNDWYNFAPRAFHYNPELKEVSKKLRDFYFGADTKNLNSRSLIKNLTNLFGDRLFTVGVSQSALIERKFTPTYLYLFDNEGGGFNLGRFMQNSQTKIHPIIELLAERLRFLYVTFILGQEYEIDVPGTSHYDEFPMLFSGLIEIAFMKQRDVPLSKDMVKLWVDFASAKPLKFRGVEFLPSEDKGELKFLHINAKNPKMISEPFKERRLLWESLNLPVE